MKSSIVFSLSLLSFIALSILPFSTSANGDLDAILGNMERAARSIKSVEAGLDQEKRDMQIGGREIYKGKIFLAHAKACDKVRINYSIPEGQVVVLDCDKIFLYQPAIQQVIITTRKAQASKNQEFSFLATPYKSVAELKSQYNIAHTGDESVAGSNTSRLELVPKGASSVKKLTLWVDQSSWLPIRYQVVEKNNDITTFTLTGVALNRGVSNSTFSLNWPKGTKEVHK